MSLQSTSEHLFERTEHAEWSIGANGQITIKDTESNWFFPLNPVATLIWDMLDGSSSVDVIVAAVCATFEVDEQTARTDVVEFVEQAQDLNLIA